jgi:thiosulfate/3-mercaptopyruvate sulfurtransferase
MQRAEKRLRTPLISTVELAGCLSAPDWLVADCRFELGKPGAGRDAWHAGHIPGAIYVDLEHDLSVPVTSASGRHPLPDPADFAQTLSRLGIGNDTQVVCYDAGPGAFAARLWWMLRWVGHDAVAVLDGGFAAWTAEGRPVSTDTPARAPAHFRPQTRLDWVLGTDDVERALARGETLVDVRAAERFAGKAEPIDAVAGHVPGAVNLPFLENLDGQRPVPRSRRARGTLALTHRREARRVANLHVRLRRDGLPGIARSRGSRHFRRAPLRGFVERVDPGPVAARRARRDMICYLPRPPASHRIANWTA